MMTARKFALSAIVAVLALAGCATLKDNPALTIALAQSATAHALSQSTDRQRIAGRIVEIGEKALLVVHPDTSATVDVIYAVVAAQIDYTKLLPEDQAIVELLLSSLRAEVAAKVGDGALENTEVVFVRDVIVAIVETARRARDSAV